MISKQAAVNAEQAAVISELTDKVAQLEEMKLKTTKHTSHKKQSYNVRNYDGYPRPSSTSRPRPDYSGATMTVVGKIADQRFCPIHGVSLSEGMSERTRTSEDIQTN